MKFMKKNMPPAGSGAQSALLRVLCASVRDLFLVAAMPS